MLQDLSYGRLENEYRNVQPRDNDVVVCFADNTLLIHRNADNTLELPSVSRVRQWCAGWETWGDTPFRYVFQLQGVPFFIWMGKAGQAGDGFSYESVRNFRQMTSKDLCFGLMTAWHLYGWYRANRFCGCCGAVTVHDGRERMLRCPVCGNAVYPRISPAVIVAVTDGDRLVLTKYAGRNYAHYALIAGFTEIGETIEQTVHREVMEEVGLQVKNLRYYKSQPWGVDGNILMGFFCDLDGDDAIHLDETELAVGEWHHRNKLPVRDDGISLTREMIRVFAEGREPK